MDPGWLSRRINLSIFCSGKRCGVCRSTWTGMQMQMTRGVGLTGPGICCCFWCKRWTIKACLIRAGKDPILEGRDEGCRRVHGKGVYVLSMCRPRGWQIWGVLVDVGDGYVRVKVRFCAVEMYGKVVYGICRVPGCLLDSIPAAE